MTLHKKSTAKFLRIRATFHDSNIEDVKDICKEHLINISFLPVLCFFWILRKTVMCMILYQELNFPKHFLQNYYFLTWANRVNYFERMTWLQLRPGSEYLQPCDRGPQFPFHKEEEKGILGRQPEIKLLPSRCFNFKKIKQCLGWEETVIWVDLSEFPVLTRETAQQPFQFKSSLQ